MPENQARSDNRQQQRQDSRNESTNYNQTSAEQVSGQQDNSQQQQTSQEHSVNNTETSPPRPNTHSFVTEDSSKSVADHSVSKQYDHPKQEKNRQRNVSENNHGTDPGAGQNPQLHSSLPQSKSVDTDKQTS
jgi:hypothetical protein